MQPSEVTDIVYRSPPSLDGVVAASIAYLYFKQGNASGVYHPYFGEHLPTPKGLNILILGVNYKKSLTTSLTKTANKVLILYNNKATEKELVDVPMGQKLAYNGHSGPYMAWKYFFPKAEVPPLVSYFEDRESKKKYTEEADNLTSYLNTLIKHHYPEHQDQIVENFEEYIQLFDYGLFRGAVEKGRIFKQQNMIYAEQICSTSWMRFLRLGNEYYLVDHVGCSIQALTPDVGTRALTRHPNTNFVAIYNTRCDGSTIFSLKSSEKHSDALVVAEIFHGGGQHNSAGFTLQATTVTLPGKMIGICEWSQYLSSLGFVTWGDNVNKEGNRTWSSDAQRLSVVCFHNSNDKFEIASYLIQERTKGEQNAIAIGLNEKIKGVPGKVDIAIVWNYDPVANESFIRIVKAKHLDDKKWGQIIQKFARTDKDNFSHNIKAVCKGIFDPNNSSPEGINIQ